MTIARAIAWLLANDRFDLIALDRVKPISSLLDPDKLCPWHKVRWAFLLESYRRQIPDDIVVPMGSEAIAAYHRHPRWQSTLSALKAAWSEAARGWPCDPGISMAILCLSQWQTETQFYGDCVNTLTAGHPLKYNDEQLLYHRALWGDRDLLALAEIPLPAISQEIQGVARVRPDDRPWKVEEVGDRLRVSFPLNPKAITAVRLLAESLGVQRGFDHATKTWLFPLSSKDRLIAALSEAKWTGIQSAKVALDETVLITHERNKLWVNNSSFTSKALKAKPELRGSFDKKTNRWRFLPADIKALVSLFPDAVLDATSVELLEKESALEADRAGRTKEASKLLSPNLKNGMTLFQHQQIGAQRMLESPVIVADDMGLGKTIMSLATAKGCQQAFGDSVIVLAPASLQDNWKREAEIVGVEVEVYSWAKVPNPPGRPFVLIADEAHYAKSGNGSQRGKRFLKLALNANCMACWPLTGTPMKNGLPIELFPLLQAIRHPLGQNLRHYELRYCDAGYRKIPGKNTSHWFNKGAKNLDELFRETERSMLRRKKEECLDLPPKTRVIRPVEVSSAAMALYEAEFSRLRAEHQARIKSGQIKGDPTAEALVELGQLRQATSIAKAEAAAEIAEEVVSQGHSIVLFTDFATSAQRLANSLRDRGIVVDLLTGKTPVTERQAIVDRFQSGKVPVFVGTIKAGGVGLTLTQASTVVLVDRPWSPGDAIQAEDRCYRIGTKFNVLAVWLQFGPIDQRVDQLLEQKSDRIELVLQGKRKTLRGIQNIKDIANELAEDIFSSPRQLITRKAT